MSLLTLDMPDRAPAAGRPSASSAVPAISSVYPGAISQARRRTMSRPPRSCEPRSWRSGTPWSSLPTVHPD